MSELKKCPFCGGEAMTYKTKSLMLHDLCFGVMCKDTPFCCVMSGYKTEEEAINAWNTRKPVERILERLEKRLAAYKMYIELNFPKGDIVTKEIEKAIEIIKEEVG